MAIELRPVLAKLRPHARKAVDILLSAAKLGGALGLVIIGAAIGIGAAFQVRLPDAALLAFEQQPRPPLSASDERDLFLMMIGVGVFFLIWGLHRLREWVRPFQDRRANRLPAE